MAPLWQSRDARLIERFRDGDPTAFEQLYARYQPSILSFCRHLTGQREDAEDAVQHTFLSAYQRMADSDDRLDLRPWLFTVARNRCLSLLRSRSAQRPSAIDSTQLAVDGLAAEVERRQDLRDLMGDLAQLPEPQRAALLLSQLDSLSHPEIGVVLGIPSEKVKALVFQARSSLASTREAREAPCTDIRSALAVSRGSALRRRMLRRHVHQCQGCREFEAAVLRQRRDLSVLLPVVPSVGLQKALAELTSRDGAAALGTGGAAAASVASGGTAGSGLMSVLTTLGTQSAAKLAIAGVIVGGGATGAVAADLPTRIQGDPPRATAVRDGAESNADADSPLSPMGSQGPNGRTELDRRGGSQKRDRAEGPKSRSDEGSDESSAGSDADPSTDQGESNLPPGLAKKDELPPGLAKKDELSPGLAKRGATPPGKAKQRGNSSPSKDNGKSNGGLPSGKAKQHDSGQIGGGQADPGGGGNGNGGGAGNGNGNGNGDGNSDGQGDGSGGGNGNGHG